jgi:ABC-type nitrate/sulfonate/bicarbonate transport system substrate-binding protein
MKRVKVLLSFFTLSLLTVRSLNPTVALAESPFVLAAGGFEADANVSWPIYVAQEKGFLAKEGIQLKTVRTDKAIMGLIAGSFDVINAEASTAILAAAQGAKVIASYTLSERPSQYMVLGKGLTTLSELEGKTIGVYRVPSDVQIVIRKYLQKKGVNLGTISFRQTGGSRERFASLLTRQISATLLSTTYAFRSQQEGMKIVASPADWDMFPWTAVVFRKQWAEANSNIVVKYLRAIYRATLWLYDPVNLNDSLRILTPLSGLDERTIQWSLKSSIDNKTFNLNKPDPDAYQLLSNLLLSEKILSKPFMVASIIDSKYYNQAVK